MWVSSLINKNICKTFSKPFSWYFFQLWFAKWFTKPCIFVLNKCTSLNWPKEAHILEFKTRDSQQWRHYVSVHLYIKKQNKNDFFAIFLVRTWFLSSTGAVAQNWLIPQKFHQNQNCRVSKSKIIMRLWSVAIKARKAGNRPRTFFAGRTVAAYNEGFFYNERASLFMKKWSQLCEWWLSLMVWHSTSISKIK